MIGMSLEECESRLREDPRATNIFFLRIQKWRKESDMRDREMICWAIADGPKTAIEVANWARAHDHQLSGSDAEIILNNLEKEGEACFDDGKWKPSPRLQQDQQEKRQATIEIESAETPLRRHDLDGKRCAAAKGRGRCRNMAQPDSQFCSTCLVHTPAARVSDESPEPRLSGKKSLPFGRQGTIEKLRFAMAGLKADAARRVKDIMAETSPKIEALQNAIDVLERME